MVGVQMLKPTTAVLIPFRSRISRTQGDAWGKCIFGIHIPCSSFPTSDEIFCWSGKPIHWTQAKIIKSGRISIRSRFSPLSSIGRDCIPSWTLSWHSVSFGQRWQFTFTQFPPRSSAHTGNRNSYWVTSHLWIIPRRTWHICVDICFTPFFTRPQTFQFKFQTWHFPKNFLDTGARLNRPRFTQYTPDIWGNYKEIFRDISRTFFPFLSTLLGTGWTFRPQTNNSAPSETEVPGLGAIVR